MKRRRLSESGRLPGPFVTRRDDDITTLRISGLLQRSIETTRSSRRSCEAVSGGYDRMDLVECVAELVGGDIEFVLVLKGQPELCTVAECLGQA